MDSHSLLEASILSSRFIRTLWEVISSNELYCHASSNGFLPKKIYNVIAFRHFQAKLSTMYVSTYWYHWFVLAYTCRSFLSSLDPLSGDDANWCYREWKPSCVSIHILQLSLNNLCAITLDIFINFTPFIMFNPRKTKNLPPGNGVAIAFTFNNFSRCNEIFFFISRFVAIREELFHSQIIIHNRLAFPSSQHLEALARDVIASIALSRCQTIVRADGVFQFVVLIVSRGRERSVDLRSRIRQRRRGNPYQPLTLGLTLRRRLTRGWATSRRGGVRTGYSHPQRTGDR